MAQEYWVRTCQECGHKQAAQEPKEAMTDAYRNSKCRKCKSESLDYGSGNWVKDVSGRFIRPETNTEEE